LVIGIVGPQCETDSWALRQTELGVLSHTDRPSTTHCGMHYPAIWRPPRQTARSSGYKFGQKSSWIHFAEGVRTGLQTLNDYNLADENLLYRKSKCGGLGHRHNGESCVSRGRQSPKNSLAFGNSYEGVPGAKLNRPQNISAWELVLLTTLTVLVLQ
jgi:hypothetical protein